MCFAGITEHCCLKNRTKFIFCAFFSFMASLFGKAQQPGEHANVVFILVDDLGWADLGYQGSRIYESPNVDRLASEGMIFSQFYSGGPVSSPSRAAIMTGRACARTGITGVLVTPEKDPEYLTHQLDHSEFNIGEAFLKNKYATGYFGKWHLGYAMKDWAGNQGFQTAIGGSTSYNDWSEAYPDKKPPIPSDQLETFYFSPHYFTHMKDGPVGEYLTDRLTNETVKFIADNKERPFFAFLSFHTVHTPLEAKDETVARFRKKIIELELLNKNDMGTGSRVYQNLPEYAAMVSHMDENVGRLLHAIDSLGLKEKTIVIFTSDNGGKGNVTSNAPLRGAKHDLYEGGIRVPFIVRWPGKIKAGSVNRTPLYFVDCYPTLLDLAGLPLEPSQHIDGLSFKSILCGDSKNIKRNTLFWHYPHGVFQGAVRWNDFKLVYHYKTGEAELFDLSKDIGEKNDLSKRNAELTSRMKIMLHDWLLETGARFPKTGMIMP
jgi:arylsulfatase A-like enzyme